MAAVRPEVPSGTDKGLFALGTELVAASEVAAVDVSTFSVEVDAGAGIGSVAPGTSSGVQPTRVIAAAVAVMLPMMNATRRVNVLWDISPER
ncbi:hypothetical protein GCM10010052_22590 [Paenarthrobacter histidinolovorans]|nr:hypothetical protein GCM10010052_22590 [Paenarthrobacter histidinolovorans]